MLREFDVDLMVRFAIESKALPPKSLTTCFDLFSAMDATKLEPSSASRPSENKGSLQTQDHFIPVYNPGVDTGGVDERKLIRKLDLRLIPWLSLLYLLSFLDRTSIGK